MECASMQSWVSEKHNTQYGSSQGRIQDEAKEAIAFFKKWNIALNIKVRQL